MKAAHTYASSAPRARSRPVRRRRMALGIAGAVAGIVALGVSFAGAKDPSLSDKINAARSDAGQLSARINAQSAQIASLTTQAHQAGARAMVLNAQVQSAET